MLTKVCLHLMSVPGFHTHLWHLHIQLLMMQALGEWVQGLGFCYSFGRSVMSFWLLTLVLGHLWLLQVFEE